MIKKWLETGLKHWLRKRISVTRAMNQERCLYGNEVSESYWYKSCELYEAWCGLWIEVFWVLLGNDEKTIDRWVKREGKKLAEQKDKEVLDKFKR